LTRQGGWYNEKAGKREPGVNRQFGRNSTPMYDRGQGQAGRQPGAWAGRPLPGDLALPSGYDQPTREGEGRSAYAGRGSGHLPLTWVRWGPLFAVAKKSVSYHSRPSWIDDSVVQKAMDDFCRRSRRVSQFHRQDTWRKMCTVLVRGGGRSTPQFSLRLPKSLTCAQLCGTLDTDQTSKNAS